MIDFFRTVIFFLFISSLINASVLASGVAQQVDRTTDQIELKVEKIQLLPTNPSAALDVDFYQNNAYECGLSGNYTFVVMNPANNASAEAPLWIFLHGGGSGFFDEAGVYQTLTMLTKNYYNHQENIDRLYEYEVLSSLLKAPNYDQTVDNTLMRRITEGYRILAVSMCDHDMYMGLGNEYPNNPISAREVNGLQATMAAIDFVTASYPTTHVFTHGESAGSYGAWALAFSYASEGTPFTGVIADSGISSPRLLPLQDAFNGMDYSWWFYDEGLTKEGIDEKLGFYIDFASKVDPETLINADYRDSPTLFLFGDRDPFCAGKGNTNWHHGIYETVGSGYMNNCVWLYDGVANSIANQLNSPHQVVKLVGESHVPTHYAVDAANDAVDDFINDILASNPPHPFALATVAVPFLPALGAIMLSLIFLLIGRKRLKV